MANANASSSGRRTGVEALRRLLKKRDAEPQQIRMRSTGGSQTAGDGAESSLASDHELRLKDVFERWWSDMGVPVDPVKRKFKETVLSVVGIREEIATMDQDVRDIIDRVSRVTQRVLEKMEAESIPDQASRDAVDMLSRTVHDIEAFVRTPRSRVEECFSTERAEKLAQFSHTLETLRIEFLEARVVHLSQQDTTAYGMQMEIPNTPTSFYGRHELVESIIELLLSDVSRRIPLLGTGGMGKTAVAAAILNDSRIKEKYGERKIFLSCEGITSVEGVIKALAAHFNLPSSTQTLSAIITCLSSAGLCLLVLDNFETVVESIEGSRVTAFLGMMAAVSTLSLILTMRGNGPPDGVIWEDAYRQPLERLSLTSSRDIWSSIAGHDDFKLDELLGRLDGLPLAIRLMARQAQLTQRSPAQLLQDYDVEAIQLLKARGGGKENSLEMTLRLSLECPTMAQEPNALKLLSVLCLLPDGASIDMLREMVPGMRATMAACATALLQVALCWQEKGRLRVLSPIRDFVTDLYPPNPSSLDQTRQYFTRMILGKREHVTLFRQDAVALLSTQFGNLSSFLVYSWNMPDPSSSLASKRHRFPLFRLKRATQAGLHTGLLEVTLEAAYFSYVTYCGDAMRLVQVARRTLKEQHNSAGTAECTYRLGEILRMQNRREEAAQMLGEAKTAFRAMGDWLGAAQCTESLGNVLLMQNRYEDAAQMLGEAKTAFTAVGDRLGAAQCTRSLGDVLQMQDRYEDAAQMLREAKTAFTAIGSRLGAAQCIHSLGNVLRMQNRYEDAAQMLGEAEVTFTAIGDRLGMAQCTRSLGAVLLSQNRYEEAAGALAEAKTAFTAIGDRLGVTHCTRSLGNVLYMQAQYENAAEMFWEAKVAFRAIGDRLGAAQCTRSLGDVLLSQNRYEEAAGAFEEAKTAFTAIGDRLGVTHCTRSLGNVLRMQYRYEDAAQMLGQAKTAFTAIGDRLGVAQCTQSLGDVRQMQSRYEDAAQMLGQAKTAFTAIGNRLGEAQCTKSLGEVLYMQDRYEDAAQMLGEAKATFTAIGNRLGAAQCNRILGDVLYSQGLHEEAIQSLEASKTALEDIGDRLELANCCQLLAYPLLAQGRGVEAERMLVEAVALYESVDNGVWADKCRARLAELRANRASDGPAGRTEGSNVS
ncbi:TPR-like protein [Calocera cornea HHB12733]|uniref:TPR-like protein n=1 Tax=Calocera cornea HHB12733 TaxID=1353952 RepID=A0A165F2R4_9BASI|nr:TPR-like protein [Calocera cornea HHB12733]